MRRWFQFSLRSVLLLVLLVATYCAGWKSSQLKHERELQEAVRKAVEQATPPRQIGGDIDLSVKVSLAPDGIVLGNPESFGDDLVKLNALLESTPLPPTRPPMR
jgi:hypothetical protein